MATTSARDLVRQSRIGRLDLPILGVVGVAENIVGDLEQDLTGWGQLEG